MTSSQAMSLCDAHTASLPAVSTANGATQEKSSIVDLKNGKAIFKQKPISFEKHSETLQEIVRFREMLEERISRRAEALPSIPDAYKPVIAKLAHESDKTVSALSKHILQELLPVQDEDDEQNLPPPLTLPVVESGIKSVANRNNYGLDGIPGVKAPAAVCVWRWEVKPAHLDWLPKNARDKAENRIAERVQAKSDLKALFDSLPNDEQDTVLDPKGTAKASASTSSTIDLTGEDMKSPAPAKKQKENEENDATPATKAGRPKKIVDSDKTAKEKEKLEKKAAKTEREQKEKDAQKKSQSLMQNFLKSKATATPRGVPAKAPASEASASSISQFDKTFKPFVVKKDMTIAPINWFNDVHPPPLTYDGDVIIVDDADDASPSAPVDVSGMSAKDRLKDLSSGLQSRGKGRRPRFRKAGISASAERLKTRSSVSVRDMIAQLNEAEVSGDDNLVRFMLTQLSDRDVVPAKVFIFADDARPGYFGTWTRNSRIIGPRTPFARDVAVFDYGYDSGEEWEEEPAGDADDVIDDGEEDDAEVEDADSDLDSWLVDDEDEPQTPQTPAGSRGGSPVFSALRPPLKRKTEATEDPKLAKKRKVVVPLVPFAKGPAWEQTIGRCEYNMFNSYRIQLFNDAPFPIDPFTFMSECGDTARTSRNDGFAVPALPDRLVGATAAQPDTSPIPSPAPAKRATLAPKTMFPDIHMTHLLDKINTSSIASLPILIDTIYQGLKDHKVKKNSIEAKVREVAEKCKVKKVWIVKENFKMPVQGA
ncbi:chromatin assembly factor 1 subunit A-domain-containing protein [Mycena filopes]|nr:chromatin assembly factor 1 subunit A-domain-containing protein [Mycena filopes]